MVRLRPPDYLPSEALSRPDFADACDNRDLGAIFRIAVKWAGLALRLAIWLADVR